MENHAFLNYWCGDYQIKILNMPKFVLINPTCDKKNGGYNCFL